MAAVVAATMTVGFAEPKDDLAAALVKLEEAENYAWVARTTFGGNSDRIFESSGKTGKDGVIFSTSTFGENTTEMIKKGEKAAIKRDEGWQSLDELRAERDRQDGDGGGRRRGGFAVRMLEGLETPVADAKDLLEGLEGLEGSEGVYTAKLTGDAVMERMRFGRRSDGDGPTIKDPAGSAKFWITDGVLTKYEVTTSGTMTFRDEPRTIGGTTSTEISGVGETEIDVPEAAMSKVGE